ncbi:MAG TPA: Crp/Fnr family transcriptional regulator [Devosiaceae bacterium]|nr:Crp/Fnr family transcriptional regulator [Devosiaceae bacterium]
MTAIEALRRKLESIGELSESVVRALETLPLRLVRAERGEEVAADGAVSTACCLLIDGYMHRQKILREGGRQILAFHFAGDIPDLQSLHLHRMDHSLIATTACQVAFIPHDPLRQLTHNQPLLGDLLWRDSLIDAAIFRTWIAMMGRQSAVCHLAHTLCELFVRMAAVGLAQDNACRLPLTQEQLADALGLSIVHTNRSLQELRDSGLIRFDGRRLVILDWAGLRHLGQFDPTYLHLRRRPRFDPCNPIARGRS